MGSYLSTSATATSPRHSQQRLIRPNTMNSHGISQNGVRAAQTLNDVRSRAVPSQVPAMDPFSNENLYQKLVQIEFKLDNLQKSITFIQNNINRPYSNYPSAPPPPSGGQGSADSQAVVVSYGARKII